MKRVYIDDGLWVLIVGVDVFYDIFSDNVLCAFLYNFYIE